MSLPVSDLSALKPRLTTARAPLTRRVTVRNEFGEVSDTAIPAERALTVYLDKRELVTLMTLGGDPELLVLGFLRNQRLIDSVEQIESITVDWTIGEGEVGEPGVAAVRTREGSQVHVERSAERVVTTGCGQGSVFGDLMAHIDEIELPDAQITQGQLYGIVNTIRLQESTYKSSGSVHGCALFQGEEMLLFVEDVGRHRIIRGEVAGNAVNVIAPEGMALVKGSKNPEEARKFYETYNQPNVHLVDLYEQPIVEITEKGVRTAEADGYKITKDLVTHFHPDHLGGDLMGQRLFLPVEDLPLPRLQGRAAGEDAGVRGERPLAIISRAIAANSWSAGTTHVPAA